MLALNSEQEQTDINLLKKAGRSIPAEHTALLEILQYKGTGLVLYLKEEHKGLKREREEAKCWNLRLRKEMQARPSLMLISYNEISSHPKSIGKPKRGFKKGK